MNKKETAFVQTVQNYFNEHGRHNLPWRKTKNPYRILVSEIMLQQTQVERVVPKYRLFLKQFPTVYLLANASLGTVLQAWQGLGYNRRAKMLHAAAKTVVHEHGGVFPKNHEALVSLQGVGHYTAGAVMAFAYNSPVPIIETNIRTVYLHHFFEKQKVVSDKAILSRVTKTLDMDNPRVWYWALMDYGSYLKKLHGNLNKKSRVYNKQSRFTGSDRQIRGAIIRKLSEGGCRKASMYKSLDFEEKRIDEQLLALCKEGMLEKSGSTYQLPR